ncbi:MAG: NTP transferase domain-containing protein [Clostridium sp.]|nr:NTP transferase domain-containing protein [Clostridium sp.]
MDTKTAAIILCAGVGSRIGLPPEQNKCAVSIGGTSPVGHCAASLLKAGADNITVVVGHASQSVRKALADGGESGQIMFVENPYFNWHGCNYSLACGMESAFSEEAERIVIAEGDSMLNSGSIGQLLRSAANAASLVRDGEYADYTRSVIAVGEQGNILGYEYDMGHTGDLQSRLDSRRIVGESMQLWLFAGRELRRLKELLKEYRRAAARAETPFLHSGVHSINMLKANIQPVFSDFPDDWINLNTQEDLRKAGNVKWLTR